MARLKALDALNQKTAKNNPLAHIGFAPGDNNTLPPLLLQRLDNSYINGGDQPEVAPTSLPASLQQKIGNLVQYWADNATTIRTDRVQIDTEMIAQYVFPNGTAVEAPFSENIGRQYLRFAAARSKPRAPTAATPAQAPKADARFAAEGVNAYWWHSYRRKTSPLLTSSRWQSERVLQRYGCM